MRAIPAPCFLVNLIHGFHDVAEYVLTVAGPAPIRIASPAGAIIDVHWNVTAGKASYADTNRMVSNDCKLG